jgi:hypothetical protein
MRNAGGRTAEHRIGTVFRVVLPLTGADDTPATRTRTPSSLTLVDVKTIHAGGTAYLNSRVTLCGAVGQRARGVDTEYRRKARKLEELPETRRQNGGSTSAVAGTLRALGKVRGLVFGQYGEASEDVPALLRAAAKAAALSAGRQQGAPSGDAPRLAALFASRLRRALGLSVVRVRWLGTVSFVFPSSVLPAVPVSLSLWRWRRSPMPLHGMSAQNRLVLRV